MKDLTGIITGVLILLFFGFLVIQNCECCKTKCATEKTPTPPEEEKVVDANTTEVEVVDDRSDVDMDTSEVIEQ